MCECPICLKKTAVCGKMYANTGEITALKHVSMKGDDVMSDEVMTLNGPFTKEAFAGMDPENLSINELAERIRRGDRGCMMKMYTILHDDLLAIAQKTIDDVREAEFLVRKSFAEVFTNHENIDPDLFELNLIQVLSENTRRMDIRNTYTKALEQPLVLQPKKEAPAVAEASDGVAVLDYSEAVDYSGADTLGNTVSGEKEDEVSHTRAIPVILSTAAAITGAAAGGNYIHTQNVKKAKAASYEQMMNALNISFASNEDGSEMNVFEYTPNAEQSVTDLVHFSGGTLDVNTKAINLNRVGETLVTYSLSATDSYDQTARTSVTRTYMVTDTRAPEISLASDSVELTEGDTFDPASVVASVADPADGALVKVDAEPAKLTDDEEGRMYETGWYTVQSSVDTSKAGEYNVLIHACDNHGNVTESSVPVTVKAKPVTTKIVSTNSSSVAVTGTVAVNTGDNVATAYSLLTGTYGLTKAAAAGIMANIQIESTFNPTAGSSYYGICQWGGSRLSNLIAFCAANGYSSSSFEGQLAFMISEMGSGMIATMNSVADSAEGAAEAGVYFRTNFERSAGLNNVANIAASFYNSL